VALRFGDRANIPRGWRSSPRSSSGRSLPGYGPRAASPSRVVKHFTMALLVKLCCLEVVECARSIIRMARVYGDTSENELPRRRANVDPPIIRL
jgi:hypothetical protein